MGSSTKSSREGNSRHKSSKSSKKKSHSSSKGRSGERSKSDKKRKHSKHRSKRSRRDSPSSDTDVTSDSNSDYSVLSPQPRKRSKRSHTPVRTHLHTPTYPHTHSRTHNQTDTSHIRVTREDSGSDFDDTTMGPALPPHLLKQRKTIPKAKSRESDCKQAVNIIGPERPNSLKGACFGANEEDSIGPVRPQPNELPMGSIGPMLPPTANTNVNNLSSAEVHVKKSIVGPALPPSYVNLDMLAKQHEKEQQIDSDSEDDFIVGPAIPSNLGIGIGGGVQDTIRVIEERMKSMKDKLTKKAGADADEGSKREEWMIELPPEHSLSITSNLSARTFSKSGGAGLGDRSGWTDTPQMIAERKQKAMERMMNGTSGNAEARGKDASTVRLPGVAAREREMAEAVDIYNATNRAQSLLEMHGTTTASAELQESKMKGGRGFDRDRDMNLRQVDDKAFKKMTSNQPGSGLKSMFSSGESRFL